jgi:hypothetical protein
LKKGIAKSALAVNAASVVLASSFFLGNPSDVAHSRWGGDPIPAGRHMVLGPGKLRHLLV